MPGPVAETVTSAATLYVVGYFALAFGNVYRTGFLATLWRSAVAGSVYLVVVGLTLTALFLPTILAVVRAFPDD